MESLRILIWMPHIEIIKRIQSKKWKKKIKSSNAVHFLNSSPIEDCTYLVKISMKITCSLLFSQIQQSPLLRFTYPWQLSQASWPCELSICTSLITLTLYICLKFCYGISVISGKHTVTRALCYIVMAWAGRCWYQGRSSFWVSKSVSFDTLIPCVWFLLIKMCQNTSQHCPFSNLFENWNVYVNDTRTHTHTLHCWLGPDYHYCIWYILWTVSYNEISTVHV